jgi:hypothetical protein
LDLHYDIVAKGRKTIPHLANYIVHGQAVQATQRMIGHQNKGPLGWEVLQTTDRNLDPKIPQYFPGKGQITQVTGFGQEGIDFVLVNQPFEGFEQPRRYPTGQPGVLGLEGRTQVNFHCP